MFNTDIDIVMIRIWLEYLLSTLWLMNIFCIPNKIFYVLCMLPDDDDYRIHAMKCV